MHASRRWLVVSVFILFAISLPLFLLASRQKQDPRSHASEPAAQEEIADEDNGNMLDEEANINNYSPEAENASNGQNSNAPLAPNTALNREVYGFITYWEVNDTANTYLQYKYLTTLAYFGLHMNKDGSINKTGHPYKVWSGATFHQIAMNAHNAGVRIHPTIVLFQGGNIHEMLAHHQDQAINNIMEMLTTSPNPVDGVNIDFETPRSADRDAYINFVGKLHDRMKAQNPNWTLVVDTLGSAADSANSPVTQLANNSDGLFVMSYHFKDPKNAKTAGSKNKYEVLQRVVSRYLSKVTPDKVILGFPLYTSSWKTSDNSLNSHTTGGAGQKLYRAIASDVKNIDVNYDPTEKTAWYALKCGNDWEEVYYDNRRALDDKFGLVNDNNLGGVGFWAFNQDRGSMDTWNAIYDSFAASGLTTPTPKPGFTTPNPTGNCQAVQGTGGGGGGGGGGHQPTPTPTLDLSQYKSADVNGDTHINLLDWHAIRSCSIFTKWRDTQVCPQGSDLQKNSDMDSNNEVDQDDITLWILKYHASK